MQKDEHRYSTLFLYILHTYRGHSEWSTRELTNRFKDKLPRGCRLYSPLLPLLPLKNSPAKCHIKRATTSSSPMLPRGLLCDGKCILVPEPTKLTLSCGCKSTRILDRDNEEGLSTSGNRYFIKQRNGRPLDSNMGGSERPRKIPATTRNGIPPSIPQPTLHSALSCIIYVSWFACLSEFPRLITIWLRTGRRIWWTPQKHMTASTRAQNGWRKMVNNTRANYYYTATSKHVHCMAGYL